MSTGYSGNLGYRMPTKWSVDQFVEYTLGDIAIDQDASSGRDKGATEFKPVDNTISPSKAMKEMFGDFSLEFGKRYTAIPDNGTIEVDVEVDQKYKGSGTNGSITVKNGKVSLSDVISFFESNGFDSTDEFAKKLTNYVNNFKLSGDIDLGNLNIEATVENGKAESIITFNVLRANSNDIDGELSFSIILKMHEQKLPNFEKIANYTKPAREAIYMLTVFAELTYENVVNAIKRFIANNTDLINKLESYVIYIIGLVFIAVKAFAMSPIK